MTDPIEFPRELTLPKPDPYAPKAEPIDEPPPFITEEMLADPLHDFANTVRTLGAEHIFKLEDALGIPEFGRKIISWAVDYMSGQTTIPPKRGPNGFRRF